MFKTGQDKIPGALAASLSPHVPLPFRHLHGHSAGRAGRPGKRRHPAASFNVLSTLALSCRCFEEGQRIE